MVNNFESFKGALNEESLKNNKGIPGQSGKPNDPDYLSSAERRAQDKVRSLEIKHGRDIGQFMSIVIEAQAIQKGELIENERGSRTVQIDLGNGPIRMERKGWMPEEGRSSWNYHKQLEKLAEDAIRDIYGKIVDGVNLDIKFPKPRQIEKSMEDSEVQPPDRFKELVDEDVISNIQRRKIANNVTQGEAKNSKLALNLPIVTDGVDLILGEAKGKIYIDLLNKITDIATVFDWKIPMDAQLSMWERDKSGFSGSVKVEWDTPEDPMDGEELAKKILDDLEKGMDLPEEETEDLFNNIGPTIHALGVDFAMLLHETVKGIYELIAANSIPEDKETAETVILNTDTLADELEDLRFGPEIAADLRDFINQVGGSSDIPNLRELVWGEMMRMEPARDFLDLMLGILNNDQKARAKVKSIVDKIKKQISDYELGNAGLYNDETEMPGRAGSGPGKIGYPEDSDYEEMSKREIEDLINQALDSGDFDKVRELSKYLKESERALVESRMHSEIGYPSNIQ